MTPAGAVTPPGSDTRSCNSQCASIVRLTLRTLRSCLTPPPSIAACPSRRAGSWFTSCTTCATPFGTRRRAGCGPNQRSTQHQAGSRAGVRRKRGHGHGHGHGHTEASSVHQSMDGRGLPLAQAPNMGTGVAGSSSHSVCSSRVAVIPKSYSLGRSLALHHWRASAASRMRSRVP